MSLFKVGDIVKVREKSWEGNTALRRMLRKDKEYTISELLGEQLQRVVIVGRYDNGSLPVSGVSAACLVFVRSASMQQFEERNRKARNTDPSTSKSAARKPRQSIRSAMLSLIQNGDCGVGIRGWTGKELAAALCKPLNSVTPRFKELVEMNKITNSGRVRDGQIVWVAVVS